MTQANGLDIVRRIQVAWPVPAIAEPTVRVWARTLMRRDYEHAKAAVAALLETSPRQPHVAEIVEFCRRAEERDELAASTRRISIEHRPRQREHSGPSPAAGH